MKRALQIGSKEVSDGSDAFVIASFWRPEFASMDLLRATALASVEAGANALNLVWHDPAQPDKPFVADEFLDFLRTGVGPEVAILTTPAEMSALPADIVRRISGVFIPFWLLQSSASWSRFAGEEKPLFLQAGGISFAQLRELVNGASKTNAQIAILQSVATYRESLAEINLRTISSLREAFPEFVVGISDRGADSVVPVGAYALGARVVERPVTSAAARDPSGMTPEALSEMIIDLKRVGAALRCRTSLSDETGG